LPSTSPPSRWPSSISGSASRSICYGAGRTSIKGRTIDGGLVAKSVADKPSAFNVGDRVFHQKFGNGNVSAIEGNKLTIDFDKAGQKRVLDGLSRGCEDAATTLSPAAGERRQCIP
jgi:hypothetical protein